MTLAERIVEEEQRRAVRDGIAARQHRRAHPQAWWFEPETMLVEVRSGTTPAPTLDEPPLLDEVPC